MQSLSLKHDVYWIPADDFRTKARVPAPISSAPPTPVEPPAAAPIDRSVSQPAATGYPPVKDGGLLASFNTPFFSCSFHVMPAPFQRMFEGSIVVSPVSHNLF